MISLVNISKQFNGVTPLNNINLHITKGELISIIGPSGSGKTTLLNIIAGLLKPTSGDVFFNSTSIYELEQNERVKYRRENFGFVFQSFNLITYLTALQNVEIALYLAGKDLNDQKETATKLLKKVGLNKKLDKFPSQLSIGEQQRVAIARAVANNPKIIFADEPTGNLDSGNKKIVLEYLIQLNQDGVTILLVTHDDHIADLTRRKIKLEEGRFLL